MQTSEYDLQAIMYPIIYTHHVLYINNNKKKAFAANMWSKWRSMIVPLSFARKYLISGARYDSTSNIILSSLGSNSAGVFVLNLQKLWTWYRKQIWTWTLPALFVWKKILEWLITRFWSGYFIRTVILFWIGNYIITLRDWLDNGLPLNAINDDKPDIWT